MKTAVEWIEQQLIEGTMRPVEIIAIAKQMEKEQTMQDYSVGYSNGQVDSNRTAEQYYNETYKK